MIPYKQEKGNIKETNHTTQQHSQANNIVLNYFHYPPFSSKHSNNHSATMPTVSTRNKSKHAKKKNRTLTLPNQHSSATVQLQNQGNHHSLPSTMHAHFSLTPFCCFLCLVYILVWYPMFSFNQIYK